MLMLSTNQEHPQCHHPNTNNSNLWISTSTTESDSKGITLICPDQASKSITVQKPIHVLCLLPACSATSQHFHLPPHCKNHQMMINISLNMATLNAVNISSPELWVWQHLEDYWNKTQLHKLADVPIVPVAHEWHEWQQWTYLSIQPSWWVNRLCRIHLDTIFSHMNLCYGYRITNTWRTRDILLLLFLVLSCHLSMLTFLIRFFATYYFRWWCRGSTNLWKWQQSQAANY